MDREKLKSRQVILVTGAARSGKSEWGETLARETGNQVVYVATARIDEADPEWLARIAKHRSRRPPTWQTLTVQEALPATIETGLPTHCLLVDSLGTWVANLLSNDDDTWEQIVDQLLASLQTPGADTILIAEETGWGLVPAYPAGRKFRDRLGMLVRRIGVIADTVYLVTGGYVLNLSLLGNPLSVTSKQ